MKSGVISNVKTGRSECQFRWEPKKRQDKLIIFTNFPKKTAWNWAQNGGVRQAPKSGSVSCMTIHECNSSPEQLPKELDGILGGYSD